MTANARLLAVAAAALALGLGSRALPLGWPPWDKYAGDAAYAAMAFAVVGLLHGGRALDRCALLAALLCTGVEALQATGLPTWLAERAGPARPVVHLLLGTTFGWWDLVAYAVGIALARLGAAPARR